MFSQKVETYSVEFFSGENLYVPFPATMVNHLGEGFVNAAHSYNRTLNEPFENNQVDSQRVAEACVDVRIDAGVDTFAIFTAGPLRFRGEMKVELAVD